MTKDTNISTICSISTIDDIPNTNWQTNYNFSSSRKSGLESKTNTSRKTFLSEVNTTYFQPCNILPHFWFYKIVDKEGRPDLPAILILSEILGWFRSLSKGGSNTYYSTGKSLPELVDGKLAVSYDFLSDKLNFLKERIRKNLIHLEELDVLYREVKNIALENGKRINQLYIYINPEFYASCFRDPETDIRVGNDEFLGDESNSDFNSEKESHFLRWDLIKKKSKNRSIGSNFNSNDLNDLDELNRNIERTDKIEESDTDRENTKPVSAASSSVVKKPKESQLENTQYKTRSTEYVESGTAHAGAVNSTEIDTNSRVGHNSSKNKTDLIFKQNPARKPKTLDDFYPLTEEDCAELQSRSGRPFTKTAMNEILQSLARKAKKVIFWSKKGFLAYMTKVYEHELRDAEKTSSETFKIRSNINSESMEIAKQEKYLSEIESCLQVSPEWHLKKKLASVLDRSKAYALLTSYKRIELGGGSDIGRCILHMQKRINLTSNEKEIILNQIRATHELVGEGGEYRKVNTLELKYPEWKASPRSAREKTKEKSDLEIKNNSESEYSTNNQDQGLWGKIRQIFIKTEGEYGEALDNHWISKLDVTIDEQAKKVELMAPSEFVKSYVEEKLLKSISYSVEQLGFSLSGWGTQKIKKDTALAN